MDKIKKCASNFQQLCNISYKFIVSFQRKTQEINLNFKETDFFHLAGLQYLSDLAIPQNRKTILYSILDGKITEHTLEKSKYYKNFQINVKMRIHELSNLEGYLDTDNMIKIFSVSDDIYLKSKIDAEYLIESRLKNNHTSVYIFLGKRKEEPEYYCVKSFFVKKNIIYSGKALYWMYKEKKMGENKVVLYKHPNYRC